LNREVAILHQLWLQCGILNFRPSLNGADRDKRLAADDAGNHALAMVSRFAVRADFPFACARTLS
jgi:hypothetical protein